MPAAFAAIHERDKGSLGYLPLALLQKAKSRYSVITFLHAMALSHGFVPKYSKIDSRTDTRVTVTTDLADMHELLGVYDKMALHRVKTEIPAEIDGDLPAWGDIAVEVVVRMSSSPRFPRGKFMSAKIHVIHPPLAELEARAENSATWMAPVRTSVPGWEQKGPRPRSSRAPASRPLPAPMAAAVIMPPPEREIVREPRRGEPGYIHYDSDADIAF